MIWLDVDAAVELIVNKVPLVDSATGAVIDEGIAYNESGMDLNWNFVTTAGVVSQTNVVPTSAGDYDWAHLGNGIYKIEMTASGGASADNDTEGFGWWSGIADAILPFTSPVYGFRAAAINNSLVDGATLVADLSAAGVDAVWDEAMSGHITAGTFGTLGLLVVTQGVVETSGSNSSTQVQTDLAEATNDHYDVMTILFTSGAEAGQSRLITGYTGASGVVSWNAALTGTPADDVTFMIIAAGTTADAVWDEILTGSSHNIATSAGKRLRQIEQAFIHASGTIATVTDGHTFTLDAGAVATADYYVGDRLQIIEGTGAGQSRIIVAYTSGRVVTLDSDYVTNPDTSSLYEVDAADVHVSLSDADQAQGFVATYTDTATITLDSAAVATTDYYLGSLIIFTHGTGAGQSREIVGYTNGRVVTMSPVLAAALDTTTVWHIQAAVSAAEIADEVWDEATSGHTTAGSFGKSDADTLADTNELQADWADGGRLDLIQDIIAADTTTDIPALIATAQADLDTITGTGGALIATDAQDLSGTLSVNTKTVTAGIIETEVDAALDNAISSPTAASLAYYAQKGFIALVNKTIITEASGNTEQFNDADSTLGSIAAAFSTDGTYTTRKRMVI